MSQIRRASVSISTNIVEGCGRDYDKEFARFLKISFGSTSEVEYLFLLSNDLGYLNSDLFQSLSERVIEIKKMLSALLKRLSSES